jgi:hypothetical protein
MHAKRTLFNYGKIFVITRPLPSTIPPTTPLFPTTMSDSPADDTFDDHKLPDELDEGAQLAGNSDSGQSPFSLSATQRSIRRVLSHSVR